MGVKALFAPQIGGGVPFCRLSLYTNRHILPPGSRTPPALTRSKVHQNRAKRGKNEFLFGRFCLTLVILETTKGKNLIYFWKVGAGGGAVCLPFGVSAWCECAGFRGFRTYLNAGSGPLVVCSLPFARSLALLAAHRLQIWLYFAF